MRKLKKIVTIVFAFVIIWDVYNLFFRYRYKFDANDFGVPIKISVDVKLPLRSTLHVAGDFKCPIYIRHGFDLDKVKHKAEISGKVDTVIFTEFYGGDYKFEFEGHTCINELDKLQFQVRNLDFTVLKFF